LPEPSWLLLFLLLLFLRELS